MGRSRSRLCAPAEQPVAWHDLTGMGIVARSVRTPIMAHETLLDRFDALHLIEAGGVGVFGLKLDRPGGFNNVKKVNALAELNNLPCFMCSSIELGISTAAAAHLAVSQKNIKLACEFSGPQTIRDDIVKNPIPIVDGYARPWDAPGLGVADGRKETGKVRWEAHNLSMRRWGDRPFILMLRAGSSRIHNMSSNLNLVHLRCVRCGRTFPPGPRATTCPSCREDIDRPGILDLVFDYPADPSPLKRTLRDPQRSQGIWAYEDFLPVAPQTPRISLGEGHTPLIQAPALAAKIGLDALYLKNECQSPTGSFKDRVAAVVVAKALEAGAKTMILVSSGNMATSVAAYGALAGLETVAIVSPRVSRKRMVQIAMYGGRVIAVEGTSSNRIALCSAAADQFGWANANSPYNPYGPHGAKTISYELFSQTEGELFDWVFSPVGFGCNFVGNWKGFEDLRQLGLIDRSPRMAAVQAEGSPSIVRAFAGGLAEGVPGPQDTIAGGISQVVTPNSILALQALRASEGAAVAVKDEEMLAAISLLARTTGIYAEPAGAAALAGLIRMAREGRIDRKDRVVVLISGSGLKDPHSSSLLANAEFPRIDASLTELQSAYQKAREQ